MIKTRQAFLFVSHLSSGMIVKEFKNICRSTKHLGDAFFLYDATNKVIPDEINKLSPFLYSRECLSSLGYPTTGGNIIPGHAHFPIFQFYLNMPDYDYYWVIEYDVRFSGEWQLFFDCFQTVKSDFLTCHIRSYAEDPHWPWWKLNHPRKSIPLHKRICSFNPIYRMSKDALFFLDKEFKDGWCGHHEVALPTLLHHNGFSIREISGKGKFTIPGMENKFYSDVGYNRIGKLSKRTLRYRPAFLLYGKERNKLYHPVKPLTETLNENISFYLKKLANQRARFYVLKRLNVKKIIGNYAEYYSKRKKSLSKPKVGIVITSYNHIDYTQRALESFYSTVNEKIDYELWLLDDNSTDDIESIYNKYKNNGLKFYKNSRNAGLTSLWNKGFELNKDKEYLVLCNNDVIFSNHWADNLIGSLRNERLFSVAVPVTNAPGHVPEQHVAKFVANYVPTDNQCEINLISERIKNKNRQKIIKGNGFCLAVKVSLLSRNLIKGHPFNEKFPLFGGEDEFFARVKPKTMLVPGSFIFHYKHVSVDSGYFPDQKFSKKDRVKS
jgi:GT2 family glycosyltransferase